MSSGIVFVLHGASDEAYAVALAQALTPTTAFPALVSGAQANAVKFGLGAVCVVAWSGAGDPAAFVDAIPADADNIIVLTLGDAPAPQAFAALRAPLVRSVRDAAADAAALQPLVAHVQAIALERMSAGRRAQSSPKLAAKEGDTIGLASAPAGKPPLAMRSAVGLVATMAVVGVVAPMINQRASATAPEPDSADAVTAAASVAEPTVLAAAPAPAHFEDVAHLITSEGTPLVDQWLTGASVEEFAELRSPRALQHIEMLELSADAKLLTLGTAEASQLGNSIVVDYAPQEKLQAVAAALDGRNET